MQGRSEDHLYPHNEAERGQDINNELIVGRSIHTINRVWAVSMAQKIVHRMKRRENG